MVVFSYTVMNPGTMMVKFLYSYYLHTLFTVMTVSRILRLTSFTVHTNIIRAIELIKLGKVHFFIVSCKTWILATRHHKPH